MNCETCGQTLTPFETRAYGDTCMACAAMAREQEDETAYQEDHHVTSLQAPYKPPFETIYQATVTCSCGWTVSVSAMWQSDLNRSVLVAALRHKNQFPMRGESTH